MRHLIFRVPKRDHNFDNHPHVGPWCTIRRNVYFFSKEREALQRIEEDRLTLLSQQQSLLWKIPKGTSAQPVGRNPFYNQAQCFNALALKLLLHRGSHQQI